MHNANNLNIGQHNNMAGRLHVDAKRKRMLAPHPPTDSIAATMHALEEVADIVANGVFTHPDNLTQDGILAYALALLRVRECAGMARMERLMNACDALAVTVSSLIDNRASASPAKCEALTRFVVHAREMIRISASESAEFDMLPLPTKPMRIHAVAQ